MRLPLPTLAVACLKPSPLPAPVCLPACPALPPPAPLPAEAKKYAQVNVAATGDNKSVPAPATWALSPDAKYVHYCDNETIQGVEFKVGGAGVGWARAWGLAGWQVEWGVGCVSCQVLCVHTSQGPDKTDTDRLLPFWPGLLAGGCRARPRWVARCWWRT